MKKIIQNVLLLLTASLVMFCAVEATAKASPLLYTLTNAGEHCGGNTVPANQNFPIEKLDSALDQLLSSSSGTETLIVYVHGRAAGREKEPDKSLKDVMPCLEKENPVKVLMFFWPGSADGGSLGFPEDRARQAAPELGKIFTKLKAYKEINKDRLKNRKIVLLLHSMGNIVFDEFMRTYDSTTLPSNLFDTIILSASATAAKDHASWLKKTNFSSHIYVTVNNHDPILGAGGMLNLSARLGKKLRTAIAGDVDLANNATYVDISNTRANTHRYFLHSNQAHNQYIEEFFKTVLNGKPFDFSTSNGIDNTKTKQRDGAIVYYLRR